MTGLDTNVLARYLTEDDPPQARKASALIASTIARGERCYVSAVVLCELTWVLRSVYDVSKADLLTTLDRLMATSQLQIGDKDIVREALAAFRKGRADFADYVIGAGNVDAGCARTATFDRRLRAHKAFQVL